MNHEQAMTAAAQLPVGDPQAFFAAAVALVREDYPELLLPHARAMAERHSNDARLWQVLGLAARGCGESGTALAAFSRAASLAPRDALIAHSHARAALEAGKPAAHLFEQAFRLAPNDGSILVGRLAARVSEGEAERGAREMIELLRRNPLWLDGHLALAKVLGQLGHDPGRMLGEALQAQPGQDMLLQALVRTRIEGGDFEGAASALAAARSALGSLPWIILQQAHVESERGQIAQADRLFDAAGSSPDTAATGLLARHLIRAGRADQAVALLEPQIGSDREHMLWPYLSLGWRMTGNPQWDWLEGDPHLVSVVDIAEYADGTEILAEHIRHLHFAMAPPLDQSVRGGTQTDGNLLLRDEPVIRNLRAAILRAVEAHIAQLPAHAPGHPTLISRRAPARIAGSWSVRLQSQGFHTDHVHSHGWISSAFYVALPDSLGTGSRADNRDGWLTLGECRELVPDLAPFRTVEPRVGRLVLFPSTMWHGTRPFSDGERMTVAFDIAYPKQS